MIWVGAGLDSEPVPPATGEAQHGNGTGEYEVSTHPRRSAFRVQKLNPGSDAHPGATRGGRRPDRVEHLHIEQPVGEGGNGDRGAVRPTLDSGPEDLTQRV